MGSFTGRNMCATVLYGPTAELTRASLRRMFASSGSVLVSLSAAGINAQTEANFRRKGLILFHH